MTMYARNISGYIASVFLVALVLFSVQAPLANAALISDEQVEEQKKEILIAVVEVLRQDIKLLQMILIQKLEADVQYLQAQADLQNA